MPGLFGVVSRDLSPRRLRAAGLRMAEALRTRPWLKVELRQTDGFCGGRVHLGVRHPEPQPLATRGGVQLWLHGSLFPERGSGAARDAADLEGLLDEPVRLANADGAFTLARWDPEAGELGLANDRLGFSPLYWTPFEGGLAYAAETKALLALLETTPPVDRLGLYQLLTFDHMLGQRTWWEGIELLPPASSWNINLKDDTTIDRVTYWSFEDIRREPVSPEAAAEEAGRLWTEGIERRLPGGDVPLLLSGGLDSRYLLAELLRMDVRMQAVTFGAAASGDVRLARRAARKAGVPHHVRPLDVTTWWEGREEGIWQVDGLVSVKHLHAVAAREALRWGSGMTFKHASGDTLFGGSKIHPESVDHGPGVKERLRHMARSSPLVDAEWVVEASLADCAGSSAGPGPDPFTMRQRQRRMILTGPLSLSAHCAVENPGVDLDLLELLLGRLTERDRFRGRFYRLVLLREHPGYFRNLPWAKTGRGLEESWPVRIRRGLRTRARRLRGKPGNPYGVAFLDYGEVVARAGLREHLASHAILVDEVLGGEVSRLLDDPERSVDTATLLAVLTADIYLRQVAGRPTLPRPASAWERRRGRV